MQILTSAWLRRIALPLRASRPDLYVLLNRMRQRLLRAGRPIQAHQHVALLGFARCANLRGARILEVGCDPQMTLAREMCRLGAGSVVGINNGGSLFRSGHLAAGQKLSGKAGDVTLVIADAARLPFADNSFDHIFSVSTFEHILDLPRALIEMHRVLRSGGVLYSHFGPIWSGCKGHHLRVSVNGKKLHHGDPRSNPLPDYAHLLLSRSELRTSLATRIAPELIEPTVRWVYDDPGISRVWYHQYQRMFADSGFELRSLRSERDPIHPQLRRILELKYPEEKAFDVTNVETVLIKTGQTQRGAEARNEPAGSRYPAESTPPAPHVPAASTPTSRHRAGV